MHNKILVTGGLGNLGSWITAYLCQNGFDVYVLSRNKKYEVPNSNYTLLQCDITNLKDLNEKLNFNIDYCVHTASVNEYFLEDYPKKALETNALGTRNLLEVLSKKNLRNFIYFSTFHVYGTSNGIITEETKLEPKNDYATTHLFAEYYIKQFYFTRNLKYTILRITNGYGAPMHIDSDKWYLVLNDLVKSAYKFEKIAINSNGKAKRDFIYMGDVASIVGKILQLDASNEIYNVSSNENFEILDIAHMVQNVYEKRYKKAIKIKVNENDKNEYKDFTVCNAKLKKFINFQTKNHFLIEINKIFDLLEKN